MHHVAIAAAHTGSLRFFFNWIKEWLHRCTPEAILLRQADGARQGWIREQSALFSLSVESREEEVDGSVAKLRNFQRKKIRVVPRDSLQGFRILPRVVSPLSFFQFFPRDWQWMSLDAVEMLLRGVRSYICLFENKGAARPSYSASALGTGQQSSTYIATGGLQVAPAVRNVDIIEDIYEYTIWKQRLLMPLQGVYIIWSWNTWPNHTVTDKIFHIQRYRYTLRTSLFMCWSPNTKWSTGQFIEWCSLEVSV